MEGAAVKLREASRHLCTGLTGHPGAQLSDCVLGVGSPVQNKSVVELHLGSLAAVRKTKENLCLAALLSSFRRKFLGTTHLLVLWVCDVFQLFVMLKANSSNLSRCTQKNSPLSN